MTRCSRARHAVAALTVLVLASCSSAVDVSASHGTSTSADATDTEPGPPVDDPTASQPTPCTPDESEHAAPPDHVDVGTEVAYEGVPPVSGTHWAQWPDITLKLYVAADRPELEELVHSHEHAWTFVWYDESIAGESQLADLRQVAFDIRGLAKTAIVPWTSADGEAFPDGMHVAITHWSASGGSGGTEWRQFCEGADSAVITAFTERHPDTDAPEPNGP